DEGDDRTQLAELRAGELLNRPGHLAGAIPDRQDHRGPEPPGQYLSSSSDSRIQRSTSMSSFSTRSRISAVIRRPRYSSTFPFIHATSASLTLSLPLSRSVFSITRL